MSCSNAILSATNPVEYRKECSDFAKGKVNNKSYNAQKYPSFYPTKYISKNTVTERLNKNKVSKTFPNEYDNLYASGHAMTLRKRPTKENVKTVTDDLSKEKCTICSTPYGLSHIKFCKKCHRIISPINMPHKDNYNAVSSQSVSQNDLKNIKKFPTAIKKGKIKICNIKNESEIIPLTHEFRCCVEILGSEFVTCQKCHEVLPMHISFHRHAYKLHDKNDIVSLKTDQNNKSEITSLCPDFSLYVTCFVETLGSEVVICEACYKELPIHISFHRHTYKLQDENDIILLETDLNNMSIDSHILNNTFIKSKIYHSNSSNGVSATHYSKENSQILCKACSCYTSKSGEFLNEIDENHSHSDNHYFNAHATHYDCVLNKHHLMLCKICHEEMQRCKICLSNIASSLDINCQKRKSLNDSPLRYKTKNDRKDFVSKNGLISSKFREVPPTNRNTMKNESITDAKDSLLSKKNMSVLKMHSSLTDAEVHKHSFYSQNPFFAKSLRIMEEIQKLENEVISRSKLKKEVIQSHELMKYVTQLATQKLNIPVEKQIFKTLPPSQRIPSSCCSCDKRNSNSAGKKPRFKIYFN